MEKITHTATLFAEPIYHIGSFGVTNALFTSWITVLVLAIVAIILRRKITEIPKGLQNLVEIIFEGALSLCDQITGNRQITNKVFPFAISIFFYILINNWLGIMPFGGFGLVETEHGKSAFIPIIRSGTADVNTTFALAIIAVLGANFFGIFTVGLWKTINKYFNFSAFAGIFKKVRHDPTVLAVAPISFFVGVLEFIAEFAKVASLTFRLFGNVFAGEVLLLSMSAIFAYLVPIPFLFLEIFVGFIQAFIFATLILVYFTIASQDHDEHEEHHEPQEHKGSLRSVT
jgi:F-type H+-transporting ATPase subunit a